MDAGASVVVYPGRVATPPADAPASARGWKKPEKAGFDGLTPPPNRYRIATGYARRRGPDLPVLAGSARARRIAWGRIRNTRARVGLTLFLQFLDSQKGDTPARAWG